MAFFEVCNASGKADLDALVRLPAASELGAAVGVAGFRVAPAGVRQAGFRKADGGHSVLVLTSQMSTAIERYPKIMPLETVTKPQKVC